MLTHNLWIYTHFVILKAGHIHTFLWLLRTYMRSYHVQLNHIGISLASISYYTVSSKSICLLIYSQLLAVYT